MERNKLLREFYASHPYLTYAELGEVFNISRQRVETILKVGYSRKHDGKDKNALL